MTLNQIIKVFSDFASSHYQIKGFGFGNVFEINGQMKPGLGYPLLWLVPLGSTPKIQTRERRFLMLVVAVPKHDLSDLTEVWSDTEQIWDDVVKMLRNESDDYDLVNDPDKVPVSEKFADWVAGWQGEIVIETEINSNYCDIPNEL